jgi:hypothetical protein
LSRRITAVVVALALLPFGAGVLPARADADLNPVLRWDRILLEVLQDTKAAPTIAARALAVLHTCIYDAWAAYDPVAVGTRLGPALRRPPEERTLDAKREVISRAGRLTAIDLYPQRAARFDAALAEEGYDVSPPPTEGSPAFVAERACRAVLDYRHRDRSNQLGDEPGSTAGPYSDWTGYRPVNDPETVRDPDRWQPLRTADGRGGTTVQQFTTPHWGEVLPFAPGDGDLVPFDPGPPRAGTPIRQAEIDEMVEMSAELTDEQKVIAEYWVDGPGTESPPGHWMIFGQLCSRRDAHGLDFDVKLFFVLANALHDAGVATWARKRHFDSIRPASLVPLTYAGRKIRSWGGPYRGTQTIEGSEWRAYLPTPPFGEYPSGHSSFSAAGAEALRLFTGRDDFGATVVVPAGSSSIEPGAVPAKDVVLHWNTFTDAANEAALSRRLGGIHFLSADVDSRLVGREVAARVMAKAQEYFAGTASSSAMTPG